MVTRRCLLMVALLLLPLTSIAGVSVSKSVVYEDDYHGTLVVKNHGDSVIPVRAVAYKVVNEDGEQKSVPTRLLKAVPPVATLAPGDSQIIRLSSVDKSGVQSFRIGITEPKRIGSSDVVMETRLQVILGASNHSPKLDIKKYYSDGTVHYRFENKGSVLERFQAYREVGDTNWNNKIWYVYPGEVKLIPSVNKEKEYEFMGLNRRVFVSSGVIGK